MTDHTDIAALLKILGEFLQWSLITREQFDEAVRRILVLL